MPAQRSLHCTWIVPVARFRIASGRKVDRDEDRSRGRRIRYQRRGLRVSRRRLRSHGVNVLTVDFGVLGDPPFLPDVTNAEVARAGGAELSCLRQSKDKTLAMRAMAEGLPRVLSRLRDEGRLDGVCGMGGSGGTTILAAGMRALPIGVPKLLISTVAAGDVSAYVGSADVTHDAFRCRRGGGEPDQPANLHQRRRRNCRHGARQSDRSPPTKGRCVAASMFGNTTACIDRARASLDRAGWEVLVFHATGTGGRTMQRLGIRGAPGRPARSDHHRVCRRSVRRSFQRRARSGSNRRRSRHPRWCSRRVASTCAISVRARRSPTRYGSRLLYEWNANVTLMRTNVEENRRIGALDRRNRQPVRRTGGRAAAAARASRCWIRRAGRSGIRMPTMPALTRSVPV